MTALGDILKARIAATGPITLAEYMATCLQHPQFGYYATRDPFGAAGDFTTAPEISQMFGEVLGLCLAQCWLDQGSPAPFALAELGPGRGTLMADILRATRNVPGFHGAAQVVLVETSPTLRAAQAQRLAGCTPVWVDTVDDLPNLPLFLIANEFFDALPIDQFQRGETGWHMRLVGLSDDALQFGRSPALPAEAIDPRFADDPPGSIVEASPALPAIAATLGQRIAARGGVALVIDYGGWRSKGDTLQAVRRHQPDHPLAHPGEADLTAHVDFEALARATGLPRSGLTDQGALLNRLGIAHRAERLAAGLTGDRLETHRAALHRLTDPREMGSLFKAIAFHAPGTPAPPGFDPSHA
ncbi:class I SAM-dependent methyltransferase [Tabrizicola sp. BL-A-41-H6]|uniref:class I SAM-dependent methyltransferase n=1 Tax=Tabrizicola sp. BL-A-41-H6 TaxID=3421107 RepID=UPI003D6658B4